MRSADCSGQSPFASVGPGDLNPRVDLTGLACPEPMKGNELPMSVVTNTDVIPVGGDIGDPCAYCHKSTAGQKAIVSWFGITLATGGIGEIVLHPSCALEWAAHLTSDATVARVRTRELPANGSPEQLDALRKDAAERFGYPGAEADRWSEEAAQRVFAHHVEVENERKAAAAARRAPRRAERGVR